MPLSPELRAHVKERNERIYNMRITSGLTYREIADKFEISRERVRQIVKEEHANRLLNGEEKSS